MLLNKDTFTYCNSLDFIQTYVRRFILPYLAQPEQMVFHDLDQPKQQIVPSPNLYAQGHTLYKEIDYLLENYGHLYYARMIQCLWDQPRMIEGMMDLEPIPPNILLSPHFDWHPFVKRHFGHAIAENDDKTDPVGNAVYWQDFPFDYLSKITHDRLSEPAAKKEYHRHAALCGDVWAHYTCIEDNEATFKIAMQSTNPLVLEKAYHLEKSQMLEGLEEHEQNEKDIVDEPTEDAKQILNRAKELQQDWVMHMEFKRLTGGNNFGWPNPAYHYVYNKLETLSPWVIQTLLATQNRAVAITIDDHVDTSAIDTYYQGYAHLDLPANRFTHRQWHEPIGGWQLCNHARIFNALIINKGISACIFKARSLALKHKVNPFLKRKPKD